MSTLQKGRTSRLIASSILSRNGRFSGRINSERLLSGRFLGLLFYDIPNVFLNFYIFVNANLLTSTFGLELVIIARQRIPTNIILFQFIRKSQLTTTQQCLKFLPQSQFLIEVYRYSRIFRSNFPLKAAMIAFLFFNPQLQIPIFLHTLLLFPQLPIPDLFGPHLITHSLPPSALPLSSLHLIVHSRNAFLHFLIINSLELACHPIKLPLFTFNITLQPCHFVSEWGQQVGSGGLGALNRALRSAKDAAAQAGRTGHQGDVLAGLFGQLQFFVVQGFHQF